MGLFAGKVAIVTGAGGGIGRAHALAFAREGAAVVVNDLGVSRDGQGGTASMAEAVAAEIMAAGGEAVANSESVADTTGAEAIVRAALDRFGRLDILINNAGILRDRTILKMTDEDWDLVQAVHLRGSFLCLRAACRALVAQGSGGAIINTSSTSGLMGNFGQANYGAAKAGIAGLTRTAALEMVKHGIRVNALVPVAKTRMNEDLGGVSSGTGPEWIPPIVLYLASDLAKDVTGRIFFAERGTVREYYYEVTSGIERSDRPWTPQEIASEWRSLVKRVASGPEVGEGDLDTLMLAGIPSALDPGKARGWNARIHFDLVDGDGYTLAVTGGRGKVVKGLQGNPTCVVSTDRSTVFGVLRRELDSTQAYMKGKLRISNLADIVRFSEAYDPDKAKAAQPGPGGIVVAEDDLTQHGMNRACVGAKLRGNAVLLLPELVQKFTVATGHIGSHESAALSPLIGVVASRDVRTQALSMLAEPEVSTRLSCVEHEIELVAPLKVNDLVFPVILIRDITSRETEDRVVLETTIRREGDVVQRQRWVGAVGRAPAGFPASPREVTAPRWRGEVHVEVPKAGHGGVDGDAVFGESADAPALRLLAATLRTLTTGQIGSDPERLRLVRSTFHALPQPGDRLTVQCWPFDAGDHLAGLRFTVTGESGVVLESGELRFASVEEPSARPARAQKTR